MADDDRDDADSLSLFERKKADVRQDRQAANKQYIEIRRDFGYYAGGETQWEPEDIIALDAAGKPHATFNFIMPSVSAVTGMEVSNRQEVTYLPRTTQSGAQASPQAMQANGAFAGGAQGVPPGMAQAPAAPGANDQGPAELLTAAAQYFRDQCDAEDEESDAFQDTSICGMGWTETRVDYEEEAAGKMIIDRCDPVEMGWDCHAQKRNLVDSRRFHRVRQLDRRAALDMFPAYDLEEIDAAWARPQHIDTEPHDAEAAREYANDTTPDGQGKLVTVVEITWFDIETKFTVANQTTGQVLKDVDKATVKKLRERTKALGQRVAVTTEKKRVYRQAFLGASEILLPDKDGDDENGTLCQSQKGFKFGCITGTRDRNAKQWMGIVRAMRDPQRWANALYSSTLYTVMTSGKGIMAERDAFENPTEAENGWAQQDKIAWLKIGALSGQHPKVMPKVPSALPPGIDKLMEFAIAAMRGVSGVNLETLGATDRDQAASLEYQRRQAATTILAPFFDGLRRYRKGRGRVMLDLIDKYLSDGRLIRIAGPDYEQYVPLIRDPSVQEYDIIVAESPSAPNQKQEQWEITKNLLPVVGKNLGPQATAALLEASPLSESTVKKFKEGTEKDMQAAAAAPNPELEAMQLQMQQDQQKHEQSMAVAQQKANQDSVKANAEITLKGMEITLKEREIEMAKITSAADLKMRAEEIGYKRQEMDGKAKEGEAKRNHDQMMRQMEIDGDQEKEGMKTFSKDLPALIQSIAQQQQQATQASQALAEAITLLARATMAERVTEMPDPVTGQTMRAVSRVQAQQTVN